MSHYYRNNDTFHSTSPVCSSKYGIQLDKSDSAPSHKGASPFILAGEGPDNILIIRANCSIAAITAQRMR